jgi:GxxExxY protein
MGKCSNCHEDGHTIRTCPKLSDSELCNFITVSDEVKDKLFALINICKEVSSELKKGFSENVYEEAICVELQLKGIQYSTQEIIPITYKGRYIGSNRLDIILHTWFPCIIEMKATSSAIKSEERWQVVRYMNRKNYEYGIVINFNQSTHGNLELSIVIKQDGFYYCDETVSKFIKMNDY